MFNLEDDAPARRLAYACALMLILLPVLQTVLQSFPLQLGSIQWRFQAANVWSTVLIFPFLGFALLALIARVTEARGVSKTVGIISAIIALVLGGALVLYMMDALQLRSIVQSQSMQGFKMAILRTGIVTSSFMLLFALVAITALRPPRGIAPAPVRGVKRPAVTEDSPTLVVGQ